MAARGRHIAMVTATAESVGATPVGFGDLPCSFGTGARTARRAAEGALVEAERRHLDLERDLAAAESERHRWLSAVEDAAAARLSAERNRSAGEAARDELGCRTRSIQERSDEVRTSLEDRCRQAELLSTVLDRVEQALAMVIGRSLDSGGLPEVVDELGSIADSAAASGVGGLAAPLREWAGALRDGTAALDPDAQDLLEAFADLDRCWSGSGSGDPAEDPAVLAAQADVLSAQSDLALIDSQVKTGTVGVQTAALIERAHDRRVELESKGNAAAEALATAVAAEADALCSVGFDSMLDFQIAVSTRGVGALVDRRREAAAAELVAAEQRLEQARSTSRLRHAELNSLRDRLGQRTATLVGGSFEHQPQDALRGLFAPPSAIAGERDDLAARIHDLEVGAEGDSDALAELAAERVRLDDRALHALAAIEEAVASIETAEHERVTAESELADALGALDDAQRHVELSAVDVTAASTALNTLAGLSYVQHDVTELRDAILAVVAERAGSVTPDGTGPRAVVIDDPLDALQTVDALDVFETLLDTDWGVPVYYVTSRSELTSTARKRPSDVNVVDGRRKIVHHRRPGWRIRRSSTAPIIAGGAIQGTDGTT